MITLTRKAPHVPDLIEFVDTETQLIRRGHIFPEMICTQRKLYNGNVNNRPKIYSAHFDAEQLYEHFVKIFSEDKYRIVFHNSAFDLMVLLKWRPKLRPLVSQAIADLRVFDTQTARKVLALAHNGKLEYGLDGKRILYALDALDPEGVEKAAVRTEFSMVANRPVHKWPKEFVKYAENDPCATERVYWDILGQAEEIGQPQIMDVVPYRVAKSYALAHMTTAGMKTVPENIERLREWIEAEYRLDKYPLLEKHGLVKPAQPPRPYKNDPTKFTKGKEESAVKKPLQEEVLRASLEADIKVPLTDTGIIQYANEFDERKKKLPADDEWLNANLKYVSANSETYGPLAAYSPVLKQFAKRQKISKLATSYIKRFYWDYENELSGGTRKKKDLGEVHIAPRIHFGFEDMVSTGRVGSRQTDFYPSMSGQTIDPRIKCGFRADKDHWLLAADYGSLELRCAAAMCIEHGWDSVLVKLYERGMDSHAYLAMDLLADIGGTVLPVKSIEEAYAMFTGLKTGETQAVEKGRTPQQTYKFWRKWGKLVGLAAWGGMQAATMCAMAHGSSYDMPHVTVAQCKIALKTWARSFPESQEFFSYINEDCRDEAFDREDDEGKIKRKFWHVTPLGMIRRNLPFTVVANGVALQPRGAEGNVFAAFNIVEACHTKGNPLYGCTALDFIHDEYILQVPKRKGRAGVDAAAKELARLMCEGMSEVCGPVPIEVEYALMEVWNKYAEPTFDEDGFLAPSPAPEKLPFEFEEEAA